MEECHRFMVDRVWERLELDFFFLFRYADFPTLGRLVLFATPQLVFVWLT